MKGSEHSDVNTFISILEVNIFIFYTKQAIHTCRDRATKILKSFFDQRPQRPISSSCIQNDALKNLFIRYNIMHSFKRDTASGQTSILCREDITRDVEAPV